MFKIWIITTLFFSILAIPFVHASIQPGRDVVGWAWSSNVGWISLSCSNTSSCASVDYGVVLNSDGTLVGYAWSSNIGWIQFGGLSGFPSVGGTVAANVYNNAGAILGWARALSYTDGWDGWISFVTSNSAVNFVGNNFVGYAWGSLVLGWIHLDAAGADGVRVEDDVVTLAAEISGLNIEGTTVSYNSDVTFQYVVGDIGVNTCALSKTSAGGSSFTPLSNITTSGSATTGALLAGSYVFELLCTNGMVQTVSFNVGAQPAGFTLGSSEDIKIVFATSGSADSESKVITINAVGGFTGDVTLNPGSVSPSLPVGTTILYSFNGGAFGASPSVTIPYNGSASFKVQVSNKITSPYTVTLVGSSSGLPDSTKQYILTPTTVIPKFEEY